MPYTFNGAYSNECLWGAHADNTTLNPAGTSPCSVADAGHPDLTAVNATTRCTRKWILLALDL